MFTDKEYLALRKFVVVGASVKQIAQELNKTEQQVQAKILNQGFK